MRTERKQENVKYFELQGKFPAFKQEIDWFIRLNKFKYQIGIYDTLATERAEIRYNRMVVHACEGKCQENVRLFINERAINFPAKIF